MKRVSLADSLNYLSTFFPVNNPADWIYRLKIDDPATKVVAFQKILEVNKYPALPLLKVGVQLSKDSQFLRVALYEQLVLRGFTDLSQKIVQYTQHAQSDPEPSPEALYLRHTLTPAPVGRVQALLDLYRQSGYTRYLRDAAHVARANLNFDQAWPHQLRLLYLQPNIDDTSINDLVMYLSDQGQEDKLTDLARAVLKLDGVDSAKNLLAARLAMHNTQHLAAIDAASKAAKGMKTSVHLAYCHHLMALCYENISEYNKAAQAIQNQNQNLKNDAYTFDKYKKVVLERAATPARLKSPAPESHVIMTGFPRSGTTLLENALSAHPSISVAEEVSALSATYQSAYAQWDRKEGTNSKAHAARALDTHRQKYFFAISRYTDNCASITLDKTPILSAEIKYLEKMLPNQRYIFSIRHPYDVVLSNFKQRYNQNNAMAAFNEIRSSCDLYDLVMSQWFDVFPESTDRVCYVYYDELVTEFDPTVRRVINFLGLEWDKSVLDFAEHSKARAIKTPSYANVRKGLSLGVQSSYQNYLFLFDDYCRSKLDPWVRFFQYEIAANADVAAKNS